MGPDARFLRKPRKFWAYVKLISEVAGYSSRTTKKGGLGTLKTYGAGDIALSLGHRGLPAEELLRKDGIPTEFGREVLDYLNMRREVLLKFAEPNLQSLEEARAMFEAVVAILPDHGIVLQTNKQAKEKQHPLYLWGTVAILARHTLGADVAFNPDPGVLLTISDDSGLQRVLARRLDGAFPSTHNPRAIWECKEYYGTTTFGSRVADGIYETMLIGEELQEVKATLGIDIAHYLFVDDRFTWWKLGRSYLCRIVDSMQQGHIDEVIFGKEVLSRWPEIVSAWASEISA